MPATTGFIAVYVNSYMQLCLKQAPSGKSLMAVLSKEVYSHSVSGITEGSSDNRFLTVSLAFDSSSVAAGYASS